MYFVRLVLFCADAVNDFLSKNCPYIAGAISFYTLFSMFPLVLALISIAGYVLGDSAPHDKLASDIATVIPVSTDFIRETVEGLVAAKRITGIASVFGLIWASTAAFGAIRKGINSAWGIRKTRPFIKERLMDLALVIGAGMLIVTILFIAPLIGFAAEITRTVAPELEVSPAFWGLATRLISPILSFFTFLILYRFLPNTKVTLSDVWLGALLASAAFDGTKWGFLWYIRKYPIYNVVYGSVGAVMALLTWVYVSAIILLFGALVTSRYADYARRSSEKQGLKLLWIGLSRVRLRVVASTEAG